MLLRQLSVPAGDAEALVQQLGHRGERSEGGILPCTQDLVGVVESDLGRRRSMSLFDPKQSAPSVGKVKDPLWYVKGELIELRT